MADNGKSRRLKRSRSVSANSNLDAELQSSIRRQNNSSKRSRVASANLAFGVSERETYKGSTHPAQRIGHSNATPSFAEANQRGSTRAAVGSLRSMLNSVSGMFNRDKKQQSSVREAVSAIEALQNITRLADSHNSPRDSGVYFDSRPSSRPKSDEFSAKDESNQHSDVQVALAPPSVAANAASQNTLKRLHTASMTGLRKVKSLALRPQVSSEDMRREQRLELMRKMSDLQSQLNECKQEVAQMYNNSVEPEPPFALDPADQTPASPKSDRGTQTAIEPAASEPNGNDHSHSSHVLQSIEPAEYVAADLHSPDNWPLSKKKRREEPEPQAPTLKRKPNLDQLRTPMPEQDYQLSERYATTPSQPKLNALGSEYTRRSLSTITSSGDELPRPADVEKRKTENERPASVKSSRSSRIPRQMPRNTGPRTNKDRLPTVHAIRSQKDTNAIVNSPRSLRAKRRGVVNRNASSSPSKSAKDKKRVGDENLGHYDDNGEWYWGPETF